MIAITSPKQPSSSKVTTGGQFTFYMLSFRLIRLRSSAPKRKFGLGNLCESSSSSWHIPPSSPPGQTPSQWNLEYHEVILKLYLKLRTIEKFWPLCFWHLMSERTMTTEICPLSLHNRFEAIVPWTDKCHINAVNCTSKWYIYCFKHHFGQSWICKLAKKSKFRRGPFKTN